MCWSIICAIVIVVIIYFIFFPIESYASKREKSNVIFDWFSNNQNPSYNNYKNNIKDSDVVEYSAVKSSNPQNADDVYNVI